jgi:hypothetical protein
LNWLLLIIIAIALVVLLGRKPGPAPAAVIAAVPAEDGIPDEVLAIIMSAIAENETEAGELSPHELLTIIAAAVNEYEGAGKAA